MAIETTEKVSTLIRKGAAYVGYRKEKGTYFTLEDFNQGDRVCSVCGNGAAALGTFETLSGVPLDTLEHQLRNPPTKIPLTDYHNEWVTMVRRAKEMHNSDGWLFEIHDMIVWLNDYTDMSLLEIADFLEAIGY